MGPRFFSESICQACAVAGKVAAILSKGEMEAEGIVATVDEELCRACGRCKEVCEYSAIDLVETSPGVFASRVNEALCKGCGVCAVTCPTKAITVRHFTDEQIGTMMETLLREVA
jgi:heterodisulfide reductase subunit A